MGVGDRQGVGGSQGVVAVAGERDAAAEDALGDVVYVDLPAVGDRVELGMSFGEVESTKSVSELYAPITGTVIEINGDLTDEPQKLNEDPYGDGWVCVIIPDDPAQLDALLDAAAYGALIGG